MRCVLLVAGVLLLAAEARADFVLRLPRVSIEVRKGPPVVAPPVVEPPPGVPLEIAPPARPVPLPGQPHYPTLAEFAASFRPLPGNYQVTLIHPRTCCPVTLCFTLPQGCPRVKVNRDELRFDYGKYEVDIEFKKNGRVKIEYQD